MKVNKWTAALLSTGVISAVSVAQAEESAVMTALSQTTISGFVDVAGHWNLGTGNSNVPGYGFNSQKDDGFNLNVVDLQISRPMDESQWAAGYNVELWLGPDAVNYNPSPGVSGSDIAVKQAYVDLRTPIGNGLDFKLGVFDTIVGYEAANGPANPNYTRSWAWTIEPTQHTGLLMSYEFNDMISASAGIANTLTSGINARAHYPYSYPDKAESQKTYMGSLAITAPEDSGWAAGSTLYGGAVYGYDGGLGGNRAHYYAGLTMTTPIEALAFGVAFDYASSGGQQQTGTATQIPDYWAWAIGVYASYQVTEKMGIHARGEYYNESGSPSAPIGIPSIWSVTGTLQYDLWSNVLARLEVRWDQGSPASFGGRPYSGNPDANNAWLVAANAVYMF